MLHGPVRWLKSQNIFLNFTHLPLPSSLCFRFSITYRNRINTIRCRIRQRDILCLLGTHRLSTLCAHVATWRFSLEGGSYLLLWSGSHSDRCAVVPTGQRKKKDWKVSFLSLSSNSYWLSMPICALFVFLFNLGKNIWPIFVLFIVFYLLLFIYFFTLDLLRKLKYFSKFSKY